MLPPVLRECCNACSDERMITLDWKN